MLCLVNSTGEPIMVAHFILILISELQRRYGVENVRYTTSWPAKSNKLPIYVHSEEWFIYSIDYVT